MHSTHKLILSTLTVAILAACGGGDSSPTPSNILSGTVLDGYIAGATVCLDSNSNGACDAGEPSATTGSDGQFKLEVGAASTAGLNLVVDIPQTAKDSDDNGKSLQEAGKSGYTMATMAEQPSVITPLTTLVVGKIKTDALTLAAAKAQVLKELGLPEDTNLQADHIKTPNPQVHNMARETAVRLQKAQENYDKLSVAERPKDRFTHLTAKLKNDGTQTEGAFVRNKPLEKLPTSISALADGKLVIYKMRNVKGDLINASAMLFTPKTTAPAGGWPLLVFGHGTTGVDSSCAPSNILQASGGLGYEAYIADFLQNNVAVVMPDYEGRGPSSEGVTNAHPYLNLSSAGQSFALSAVAAKAVAGTNLSGAWAVFGHSQGGHAALAAAQFSELAKKQSPSLSYKGAIAVAPASNLLNTLNLTNATITSAPTLQSTFALLGLSNFYASYLVQGSSFTNQAIDPKLVFGARMQAVHQKANTCLNAYYTTVAQDVTAFALQQQPATAYTGVIASEINKPAVASVLQAMEPGTAKLPGKTLIIQGASDTTVSPAASNALQALMKSKGSDTTYLLVPDVSPTQLADHSGVLIIQATITAITNQLVTLFTPTP